MEDIDGVAGERGGVDIAAVGADGDRAGTDQAERPCAPARACGGDAAARPPAWVRRAAARVAREDSDRVASRRGDVDVAAVRADRDRLRAEERRRTRAAPAPTRTRGRAVERSTTTARRARQLDQRTERTTGARLGFGGGFPERICGESQSCEDNQRAERR